MIERLHHYRAYVVSNLYDGDTARMDIDFGLNMWLKNYSIRFLGIDAPELYGVEREEGLESRDALRELIGGKEVIVQSVKWDKYGGRIDGNVYFGDIHVNQWLVDNGYAVHKDYS